MEKKQMDEKAIIAHLGENPQRFHGAVVPPVFENSLFVYDSFEAFIDAANDERANYIYWRGTNPTAEIVEKKLAALEQGESCKLFSSGMAAISSALLAFLKSGDHILSISNVYGPATKFFNYLHEKFGVTFSNCASTDLTEIEKMIQPNTKIIYLESPTTMTFKLVNLAKVAKLAKARGIKTIIDNTWATPLYQKPITLGIDVVIHSVSKYLGGHSDLVGGALITSNEIMEQLFYREYQLLGGAMPPYEAWLLLRGMRTLPIRMKAFQETGMKVAQFLANHPAVEKVNYPGLESSEDYELGKEQLSGYSGLLSFELKEATFEKVKQVINFLHLFQIGVSWGGFESLVMAPNHGDNEEQLKEQGISPGLIRISVGLENVDELIADLNQAL